MKIYYEAINFDTRALLSFRFLLARGASQGPAPYDRGAGAFSVEDSRWNHSVKNLRYSYILYTLVGKEINMNSYNDLSYNNSQSVHFLLPFQY